jgi:hypothetical protein
MTPEFEEALGLWESGELSRDELARRFPGEDIAGVLDAFDRMSAAASGPAPDADAAWQTVRAQLPDRLADRRRGRGRAIRLLAAAMIAVLVLGATAYAVVPSMRRAMNDAAGAITGAPDRTPNPTRPGDATGSGVDQPTPGISGDDSSTTDADHGAASEDEADADVGENDADVNENDGPNDGSNDDSNDDGVEGDSGSGIVDGSIGDGSSSDDATVGDDSGSEEERADDAVDGESASSGSDGPDN